MAGSATPKIGLGMKLYYNTGTFGSPTWTLIGNVADLEMDPGTADEVEVTTRGSGGDRQYEPGLFAAAYEWDMLHRQVDTIRDALFTAMRAASVVEFAFADGLIAGSGTNYWRHECKIFSMKRSEPLGDKVPIHVVAKPCYSANAPSLTTVA